METGFVDRSSLVPKRAQINSSDALIDVVVPTTNERGSLQRIEMTALMLSSDGAGTIIFQSGSTEIGRHVYKSADPPLVLDRHSDAWLIGDYGETFKINNAAALSLVGFLTYVEVKAD